MGSATLLTTCPLGKCFDRGIGVFDENGIQLSGRVVQTDFLVTDQLVEFANSDVLPRLTIKAKPTRVIKIDDRRFFLVHGISAKRDPEASWPPFIGALRYYLQVEESENFDNFYLIKNGREAQQRTAPPPSPEGQGPVPEMAVYSDVEFEGPNRYW